jgi:hypothetical protein
MRPRNVRGCFGAVLPPPSSSLSVSGRPTTTFSSFESTPPDIVKIVVERDGKVVPARLNQLKPGSQ